MAGDTFEREAVACGGADEHRGDEVQRTVTDQTQAKRNQRRQRAIAMEGILDDLAQPREPALIERVCREQSQLFAEIRAAGGQLFSSGCKICRGLWQPQQFPIQIERHSPPLACLYVAIMMADFRLKIQTISPQPSALTLRILWS